MWGISENTNLDTWNKIKAEVGKKIYESDSYLSPLYDTADSEY